MVVERDILRQASGGDKWQQNVPAGDRTRGEQRARTKQTKYKGMYV